MEGEKKMKLTFLANPVNKFTRKFPPGTKVCNIWEYPDGRIQKPNTVIVVEYKDRFCHGYSRCKSGCRSNGMVLLGKDPTGYELLYCMGTQNSEVTTYWEEALDG
jgi:hypothetical protein